MAVDKKRAKELMEKASSSKVDNLSQSQIRVHFSHDGRCLKSSWDDLTRSLGLSITDRNFLAKKLSSMNLKAPKH